MSKAYDVVRTFEEGLCAYTGAKYAVSVTSCTMALLLAVKWHYLRIRWFASEADKLLDFMSSPFQIEIPKRTYVSVPMSIIHAGCRPTFRDEDWSGAYQLKPLPVFDSARRFRADMFSPGLMMCVSFHASKILGDTQGGAILHDSDLADEWFRRMRFDGRTEGVTPQDDTFREIGYHCYMSPDVAARLLLRLRTLPLYNDDLPNDAYPDLSKVEIFR